MNYGLVHTPFAEQTECIVLGYCADDKNFYSEFLDSKSLEMVQKISEKLHEKGDYLWQTYFNDHSLMVIHCGKSQEFNHKELKKCLRTVGQNLLKQRLKTATLCLPQVNDFDAHWQITQSIMELEDERYQLNTFKTHKKKEHVLEAIYFLLKDSPKNAVHTGMSIAQGIQFTKTLANLPANHCTPTFLGEQAIQMAHEHEAINVKVLGLEKIKELKMGALIAVGQGSIEPPCLIELSYHGDANSSPPIALVGKGITFDSGGISIKPANVMDEMKYDMAGAAAVLGTLKACALLKLPINVVGVVACAENMPSGSAVKPGDIITTCSGQTVEILNTDAEGRLVLADALTYVEQFNPSLVIDIATLTGAVIIALGHINSGLMTADDELASLILAAAKESGDSCWRLPLEEEYQEALDSPLADMINANFDRVAGTVTAACFLSHFTKKYRWAHLDVAGTAWVSGKKRHATGRPVPLLLQILRHAAHSN